MEAAVRSVLEERYRTLTWFQAGRDDAAIKVTDTVTAIWRPGRRAHCSSST